MCSRPILKHLPRLDHSNALTDSLSTGPSIFPPSSSASSTSSSPTNPSTSPPSPTFNILPFASCSSAHLYSPHVHFPPTPRLISSTYPTHSPTTYDRAPIVVERNVCALPERGGRVCYTPHTNRSAPRSPKGSYFHPRAYEACEREREPDSFGTPLGMHSTPPSLTPDLSPPSSESDYSNCDTPAPESPLGTPFVTAAETMLTARLQGSFSIVQPQTSSEELEDDVTLRLSEGGVIPGGTKGGKLKKRSKAARVRGGRAIVAFSDEAALEECLSGF